MTINFQTGEIGFEGNEGDQGSTSQWWTPRHNELLEFAEDALFWADAILTPGTVGWFDSETR
jgi:hypothetical protein